MKAYYSIKETSGIYQIMKGNRKVTTPRKSPVCTKTQNLAEWMLYEYEKYGTDWEQLFYVRFLHYSYCDMPQLTEDDRDQTKEWIKEILYNDPFWAYNEPIQNRAMVVNKYVEKLPDVIMNLPHHMLISFIVWANLTGSILLTHHILKTLLADDGWYSLDDMDDFVDELIEYGNNMDVSLYINIPWETDYLKSSIKTLVNYCSYSKV